MMRVLVLGGSGMLGAMVVDVLSREKSLEVVATVRDRRLIDPCRERVPSVKWRLFDVENTSSEGLALLSEPFSWVVNAIGVIKPYIKDEDVRAVERAIQVNSLFPHRLAKLVATTGVRVVQIATDCVYTGKEGGYVEGAPHDPVDVYGKTKSLGEVTAKGFYHLRCSIIGPEPKGHVSLLDWFRGQPKDAELTGFTNHRWNGVTTLQFANVCAGILREEPDLPMRQHLVPGDDITKAEMLETFAKVYGRIDVRVKRGYAGTVIDRTLRTSHQEANRQLWRSAGYSEPPTIREMIEEMGKYPFRLGSLR